jgi:hypothetical protein
MHKALSLIPSTRNQKTKEQQQRKLKKKYKKGHNCKTQRYSLFAMFSFCVLFSKYFPEL